MKKELLLPSSIQAVWDKDVVFLNTKWKFNLINECLVFME